VPGRTGSWAMQVANKFQDGITFVGIPSKVMSGAAFNALIAVDQGSGSFTFNGGYPLNGSKPLSTSMWVKNTCIGRDTTYINVSLYDNSDGSDSLVGTADTFFVANINTFQQVTINFNYLTTLDPTILRYTITSSSLQSVFDSATIVSAGTNIIVDDIEVNFPSGVKQYIYSGQVANVYPTEATSFLNINFDNTNSRNYTANIIDIYGRNVLSQPLSTTLNKVDISTLPIGIYLYTISSKEGLAQGGKFIKK
jgi:hypothetical protein